MARKITLDQAGKIFPTKLKIDKGMKNAVIESIRYAHSQVPSYPPPPPGSTYRRRGSGGLGGSIGTSVQSIGGSHVAALGSTKGYSPYVIGPDRADARIRQARIHQNRWYTLEGVLKDSTDKVKEIYQKLIKKLFRGV